MAARTASQEAIWLMRLLKDLDFEPVTILNDTVYTTQEIQVTFNVLNI